MSRSGGQPGLALPEAADAARELVEESEERYRLASEAANLGTWRRGGASDLMTLDARAQQHLGFSEPQITVEALYGRIHPDDRERVILEGTQARDPVHGRGQFTMEYRVVHADGGIYWLSIRARLLFAGQGAERRLRLVIGTTADITAGKLAELALRDSEARYAALVRYSPDAIFVNRNDRVAFVNERCLALFGVEASHQLLGRPVIELFDPAEHARIRARIARLRERFEPQPPVELEIVRADGRHVPVEVNASPFTDHGQPAIHVVLRDTTARRAAERERRQWADAFLSCGHGIALGDPATDRLLACNPSFAAMFGTSAAELIGAPIESLYAAGVRARLGEVFAAVMLRGHARFETELQRADGSVFPAQLDLVSVCDEQGRPLYRVASAQDITERRAVEDEVRALNAGLERRVAERTAELAAANAELESFAYAVSHDLRAPLRAMSGFSHALIEDHAAQLPAEAREYLAHIAEGSRKMGELIDGLLVLSRITRGELRREAVDVSTLGERLLGELGRAEPGRRVEWQVEPGLATRGDPRMIEIALANLLGNAWKYSARAASPRIALRATRVEGRPGFSVEDNGAGFSMAHAERLFLPFQRLHRQDEFPGLGIGLATVQRIVHRHGGTIGASAEPGRGARFSFSFTGPEP